MAELIHITRKHGNTRRLVFHFTDDAGDIDVTNFTAFQLSVNPTQYPINNADTVEVMSGYIIDALTGRVGFTPTGTVVAGDYFYDAEFTPDNAETYTFAEGTYSVTQGITK